LDLRSLVAKNAHINLNRLGAVVVEHVENMYGDSNSTLHAGSDRSFRRGVATRPTSASHA